MDGKSIYSPDLYTVTREKLFYTLVMFPYPSGYGLHVGHASNFTIIDVYARYKRLRGYTVFNPFGFDSFGLPTENYAMKLGKPAYEVTEENIAYFIKQIAALDMSFDMERLVVTSSPEYYKRTQRIFQQLYKAGLVYRDTLRVNRCPQCQTVLANDQVVDGKCERCKTEIIQKKHPQRFIKITDYAERLLQDLDLVDRPEETKIGQRNWIGKSEGAEIRFKIAASSQTVTTFTTRPDTIYGATAVVLAPEVELIDELLSKEKKKEVEEYRQTTLAKTAVQRQQDLKEKTGVFSGVFAEHPLTGEQIPVRFADYVLPDYGTGAVMMVPAHDERDFEFAKKFNIPVKKVIARETGQKRDNEEFKNGGAGIVFDPQTQKYAIAERPDGRISLFAGGVHEGESVYEGVLREVCEESGLYDFKHIEWIETSYAHYFNQAKQVNRVARAECFLMILENTDMKEVQLEEHEKFVLARKSPEEIKQVRLSRNADGGYDHYLRFLDEAVARAIELGHDTTSDSTIFKATPFTGYGTLENSEPFSGMESKQAKQAIAKHLEEQGRGATKTTYKLRDRSVSRQRYWGSPIPVYYDENNDSHLIPEEELPVILPLDLENYKPTGKSPLEDHPTFPIYIPLNKKVPFQKRTRGVWNFHENEPIMKRRTILAILYDPKQDKYGIINWLGLGQENYTFVLGGVDEGETAIDAARREIYEETGYKKFRLVRKLGEFQTEFWHAVKKRNQHNITDAYLFELIDDEHDTGAKEDNENLEFIWMTKEEILTHNQHEELRNYYLGLASGSDVVRQGESIDLYNEYNPCPTYRRECDTLDTFVCSSFYFLRYPDAHNPDQLADPILLNKCLPVDFYIGGKEHTVGHLLYARFVHKFLYDQGLLSSPEPFQKLVHQGMVLGADGRKMSKRRGNVIDPIEVIEKFGSDAVRTYLMFMGPVEQDKTRNNSALAGIRKFLERVERLLSLSKLSSSMNKDVEIAFHKAIKGLTDDMEKLKFNTAVSKLMILLNSIEEHKSITSQQLQTFGILLSSFAPQLAQQLRTETGGEGLVELQSRPTYDMSLIQELTISLPVQVNGKVRANLAVAADIDETTALSLAQDHPNVQKYLANQKIRKVIYVQGKILNIVI